ncbi:MAG TPA: IS481 family transposase [Thermomicrobiales bacterium]|nr:IS481 family transposase [Thermomicrobiales bacterium]
MPWQESTIMSQRREFVLLASREGANTRELCRRLQISPTTGYDLLRRYAAEGEAGLQDRSRRPHTSPTQTGPAMEAVIRELCQAHPTWGGRKLHHALVAAGHDAVPAPSTITAILHRTGLLDPDPTTARALRRFDHDAPNVLWQMDFMGHRPLDHGRVHPLTILDDHSRFLLHLTACVHERRTLVQDHLTRCFRQYGLPRIILTDNGPPWGTAGAGGVTRLDVWLMQLGIALWHGRAYHPQTQGKVERLHRTIAADVFGHRTFTDLDAAQGAFTAFREVYNQQRPHAALGHAVPLSRFAPSPRPFPETLPHLEVAPGDAARKIKTHGVLTFRNRSFFLGRGLGGHTVGVRPTDHPARFTVHFGAFELTTIDLTYPDEME